METKVQITDVEIKAYLSSGDRNLEALWYFTDSGGKTGPAWYKSKE